jgi:hypothetical protein
LPQTPNGSSAVICIEGSFASPAPPAAIPVQQSALPSVLAPSFDWPARHGNHENPAMSPESIAVSVSYSVVAEGRKEVLRHIASSTPGIEPAIRNPWDIPHLLMRRRNVNAQAVCKAEILCQKFHVGLIHSLVALITGLGIRQKLGESCGGGRGHRLTRRLAFRSIG